MNLTSQSFTIWIQDLGSCHQNLHQHADFLWAMTIHGSTSFRGKNTITYQSVSKPKILATPKIETLNCLNTQLVILLDLKNTSQRSSSPSLGPFGFSEVQTTSPCETQGTPRIHRPKNGSK